MNHRFPPTRVAIKEALRRADGIVANLNVLLIVIALGLATLDFTFFVTMKVVDSLPQVTRVSYDAAQAPHSHPN